MNLKDPYLATSPQEAAIIRMAIEKLRCQYNSNAHRSSKGSCEIVFNIHQPSDANDATFKKTVIDIARNIKASADPALINKFETLKQNYSAKYPFNG